MINHGFPLRPATARTSYPCYIQAASPDVAGSAAGAGTIEFIKRSSWSAVM